VLNGMKLDSLFWGMWETGGRKNMPGRHIPGRFGNGNVSIIMNNLLLVAMWSVLWLNTILIRLTYEKLGIRPLLIDN
jgi:hypothetical protein